LEALAKQVKLVCTGLVALARSRPTAFLEITLRMSPRGSPLRASQKLPFGARHFIALKLTFRMSEMRTLMA